jgi:hypothetical protein
MTIRYRIEDDVLSRAARVLRKAVGAAVICVSSLSAGAASQPLDGLLACRDVQDALSRLACFERETAKLQANSPSGGSAPVVISAPAAPAQTPAPPPLNAQQQFGLSEGTLAAREEAAGARPTPAAKITAHLMQIGGSADGHLVFTLDNDQVWKQVMAGGELLAKQGDGVTISRGWLNSYNLVLENGRSCKVQRVK